MFWRRKKKPQDDHVLWPIIYKIIKDPLVRISVFFWLGFDTLGITNEEVEIITKNQESFRKFLGVVLSRTKGVAIEVEFLRSNTHLDGLYSSPM